MKKICIIVLICILLIFPLFMFTSCDLFEDDQIKLLKEAGMSKELSKEVAQKMEEVGFADFNDAQLGWKSDDSVTFLIVCNDLIVDVEICSEKLNRIIVSSNADNKIQNGLVLYDLNKEITHKITETELSRYKNYQKESKLKTIRSMVAGIVVITNFKRTTANSVGGIDIKLTIQNKSSKTIKYVYMSFFARNAVGDEVYCSVRGAGIRRVQMTGPIGPNQTKDGTAENYWYNYDVKSYGFNYFEIEYTDGTSIVFDNDMLSALVYNINH